MRGPNTPGRTAAAENTGTAACGADEGRVALQQAAGGKAERHSCSGEGHFLHNDTGAPQSPRSQPREPSQGSENLSGFPCGSPELATAPCPAAGGRHKWWRITAMELYLAFDKWGDSQRHCDAWEVVPQTSPTVGVQVLNVRLSEATGFPGVGWREG